MDDQVDPYLDEQRLLEGLACFICERWLVAVDTVYLVELIDVMSRVMNRSTVDITDSVTEYLLRHYEFVNLNTRGK